MTATATSPVCDWCSEPVDPAEAHWPHGEHWSEDPESCDCDLYAHPDCCPNCTP